MSLNHVVRRFCQGDLIGTEVWLISLEHPIRLRACFHPLFHVRLRGRTPLFLDVLQASHLIGAEVDGCEGAVNYV